MCLKKMQSELWMYAKNSNRRIQSSFELLITMSFGLAILLPLVIIAFIQLSNTNSSLSSIEAQQAANKLSTIATVIGGEGYPAKELVQVEVPQGVAGIEVGTAADGVGHEIIFLVRSPVGLSYVTSYTPLNVSGNLGGLSAAGTYLINVTYQQNCPSDLSIPCVYMLPEV